MAQPLYTFGQVVHYKLDLPTKTGTIISITTDDTGNWIYGVSAQAWDANTETLLQGVKHIPETDVEPVTAATEVANAPTEG